MAGRILIVDAVMTNRIVLKTRLGNARYDVQLAASGGDCLHRIAEAMPDLVILDSRLPDMAGIEVLKALRADGATRDLPVILTHEAADAETRPAALRFGADDVMAKPVDEVQLMARLRALLRTRDRAEDMRLRNATLGVLGLAEAAPPFDRPALVGYVTDRPKGTQDGCATLLAKLPERVVRLSRDEALSDPDTSPDAYVIEIGRGGDDDGLALISDLRSRGASRHAAICLVLPEERSEAAAMALDLGANDVVTCATDPQELALRLRRLLHRKRADDRLRDTVYDGLRLAAIDPLTGLHNRRFALPQLGRMMVRARQTGARLAVMAIDLDRFKSVNDRYGHAAGDGVLAEVARRLQDHLRPGDLLARIGGEEFLVALPETGLPEAGLLAERLCRAIERAPIAIDAARDVSITVSIGLAAPDGTLAADMEGVAALIARADSALLLSKAQGRNQVTVDRPAA